jgi:hypothetical protein
MQVPEARHVSDPKRRLYKALEIGKGSAMSLFNPALIMAGKQAWSEGFRQGRTVGSAAQLHGLALIEDGAVIDVQRPDHAGVELNHESVASCTNGACQVF